LATAPLFVTTAVEPNVFFTFDDSGSMDWATMVNDGTAGFSAVAGLPIIQNFSRAFLNPYPYYDCDVMPPVNLVPDTWVFKNHHGNKLWYNPDVTYNPWPGVDASGNPLYGNASATAAKMEPYNGSSATINLTVWHPYYLYTDTRCRSATYYSSSLWLPTYTVWDDTDGDGEIELTDSHSIVRIAAGTPEMQNFANWFQYYRNRELVAKAALGRVINNTDSSRMGMDAFNSGHQADLETMTDPDNKRVLLQELYGEGISGGTPAHAAMNRVGNLFKGPDAILPEDEGGECQQNFNVFITDGFWNSFVDPGVGNADASGSGGETDANGDPFDGNADESNDGGNYEDGYSNTLADLAMHLYETDLRGDLANRVPAAPGIDSAEHQHLVTYTIGFGLTGTLDPETDDPVAGGADFWPDPMDTEDEERVDDLWHAAYNARGTYLSASNPEELQFSLNRAIADIAERTAIAAAASVTSARLTTESVVFLSEFNTNRWQGTVFAYEIEEATVNDDDGEPLLDENGEEITLKTLSDNPKWSASAVLDARDHTTRNIFTYNNEDENDGVPFIWDELTSAMKADLKTNAAGGTDSDTIAQARLEYLRGSRVNEGAGYAFRERSTVLGDIVHSAPVYASAPSLFWPDGGEFPSGDNAYSKYKEDNSDDPTTENTNEARQGVIYVGANDGMIHAFNEDTGAEIFAYVPSYVASTESSKGLHYLTQQNYLHQYYNDLTPTVSDVFIDSTGGGSSGWRTILIAGQRGGGKGYSALDISDPDGFDQDEAADLVMWEFTSAHDADLGYTFSRPQVGLDNRGKWVAIFGNGYNNSGSGTASLFIVDIEAGVDGSWAATDYVKLDTGVGADDDLNGLSAPQLADIDGNGTLDRAYAGDLKGNLWVFDLTGETSDSWAVAYSGNPLFNTIDNRPITSRPAVSKHPSVADVDEGDAGNQPNIMVAFGSGQYLVYADNNSNYDNYFYAVWDNEAGSGNYTLSDLEEKSYDGSYSVRVTSSNTVDYTEKNGWYLPLPDRGERVYTNPIIRSGFVFFNSSVPSVDACSAGGYGYRFSLNLDDGTAPDEPIIDINGDGLINEDDTIDGEGVQTQAATRLGDLPTDDTLVEDYIINQRQLTKINEAPDRKVGRISWQELLK
jgi:type IV pilus assembly protein PilY1